MHEMCSFNDGLMQLCKAESLNHNMVTMDIGFYITLALSSLQDHL